MLCGRIWFDSETSIFDWHASPNELCRMHLVSHGRKWHCWSTERGVWRRVENANWKKVPWKCKSSANAGGGNSQTAVWPKQPGMYGWPSHNRTAKLWLKCFINPDLTIMKYVRAEREGDWPLHLTTVNEIIPLFCTASHFNYARYGL